MLREDFEEFLSLKKPEVEEDVLCCLLILNKFFELVLFEVGRPLLAEVSSSCRVLFNNLLSFAIVSVNGVSSVL